MIKRVAVILLNWNTPQHTSNCIASLQKYCDESLFNIIIADNGSTDNSLSILQTQFPDLTFIDNKQNLGFAEGNNRALIYSLEKKYTYSLVLNTDTIVDEDIVLKLSKHLDAQTNVAAVQPAIYWMHDQTKIWNGEGCFNSILGTTNSKTKVPGQQDVNTFKTVKWLSGCCIMIKNEALKTVGLFNQKFFLYYEDVELSFRFRDAGFELHYLPACKMYHEAGVSGKTSSQQKEGFLSPIIHYYTSRNHIWILRKYANPIYFPIYFFYNLFYYATLLCYLKIRGRNTKVKQLLSGLKDGLFVPKRLIWPDIKS